MSIEQDAQKDLALSDQDAENIAGGNRAKKTAAKHAARKIYPVGYVNVPVSTTGVPDDSGTTAWTDDCTDPSV